MCKYINVKTGLTYEEQFVSREAIVHGIKYTIMAEKCLEVKVVLGMTLDPAIGTLLV
jgi:hypothetical protein